MPDSHPILPALADLLRGPLRHLLTPSPPSDPVRAATARPAPPIFLRSAPARLDVLGGLASETGAALAQMALPQRAAVAVQTRDDAHLVIHSTGISPPVGEPDFTIPLRDFFYDGHIANPKNLAERFTGPAAWTAPLAALIHLLLQSPPPTAAPPAPATAAPLANPAAATRESGLANGKWKMENGKSPIPFPGLTLIIHSQIPAGAAQASSTAITTAALIALTDALNLQLDPLDAALTIHRAETLFRPTSAHVVDALTCLHALDSPSRLLRYSAQPHQLVGQIALPRELRIMALDTGVRYTAAAAVQSLRLAGAMGLRIIETIYRDLGQRHTPLHDYLANLSPSLYRQYFRALLPRRMRGRDFIRTYGPLPERAGLIDPPRVYRVRTAVDHLISEHDHAENFLQAIEELSDPATRKALSPAERELTRRRAGRLLLASHHSYRLRLELSCREADWLVDSLMDRAGPDRGIYGARITSAGGGGTLAVLLNRSPSATDALLQTLSAYNQLTGLHLAITEAGTPPSAGALQTPGLRLEIPA